VFNVLTATPTGGALSEEFNVVNLCLSGQDKLALQIWEENASVYLHGKKGMYALAFNLAGEGEVGFALVSPLEINVNNLTVLPTQEVFNSLPLRDRKTMYEKLAGRNSPLTDVKTALGNLLMSRLNAFAAAPTLNERNAAFVMQHQDRIGALLTFTGTNTVVVDALNRSKVAMVHVLCAAETDRRKKRSRYFKPIVDFLNALVKMQKFNYILLPESAGHMLSESGFAFADVTLTGKTFNIVNEGAAIRTTDSVVTLGTYYAHSV
jgi:hypothetical protein